MLSSAPVSNHLQCLGFKGLGFKVIPKKLKTGLRTISAGIPYALPLRSAAIGFPTLGLLAWGFRVLRIFIVKPSGDAGSFAWQAPLSFRV